MENVAADLTKYKLKNDVGMAAFMFALLAMNRSN